MAKISLADKENGSGIVACESGQLQAAQRGQTLWAMTASLLQSTAIRAGLHKSL
ncbi:MAG: hypothetical protein LBU45_08045 [Azoarcus sp.]|nr:hypothetical protein [Azoarcus sp.]